MRRTCNMASMALALLGAALASRTALAEYISSDDRLPSPRYDAQNVVDFPGGVRIGSFFDVFADLERVPPPAPGTSQIHSFFDIFTELSIQAGGASGTFHPAGSLMLGLNGLPPGSPIIRSFETEILSLELHGGDLPPGVMIRESPTRRSLGETSITDIGGGLYRIDSFFDVFTELSIDGGQNWTEGSTSMRLQGGVPEPSTLTLAGLGLVLGTAVAVRRGRRGR